MTAVQETVIAASEPKGSDKSTTTEVKTVTTTTVATPALKK